MDADPSRSRGRAGLIRTALGLCLLLAAGCAPARTPGAWRVYVTNEASGDLTVIDGPSRAVVSTRPLGKRPRGLQVQPDGRGLLITLSGAPVAPPGVDESTLPPPDKAADGIGLFAFGAGRVERILRGVPNPEQVAVSASGRVYAPCEDRGSVVVLRADSGARLAEIPVGDEPEGIALGPDGARAYVAIEGENRLAVIDTGAARVIGSVPVGQRPRSVAVSRDGARVYVSNELDGTLSIVDSRTLKVARTVKMPAAGARPMGLAVSPSDAVVYVTTGRGGDLVAVDPRSGTVKGSVHVGPRPWGVAVSPDGRFVFTANGPSDDVSVVAADRMAVVARIKVGRHPWGVAVAPAAS